MAKNLWLNGTLYSNVEEVTLPQANAQGTGPSTYGVNYYDVSPTTAGYNQVLSGYSFFEEDGSFYEGTIPTLSEADVQVNTADSGSPFALHLNSVLIPSGYYSEEVSLSPVFSEATYSSAKTASVDEYGNVTTTFSPSTRGFAYSTITYSVTKSSAFHIMSSTDYTFQFGGVNASGYPLLTIDANNGGYQFANTFGAVGDTSIATQAASTYYVSTADRTITSSTWLTGTQTIKSVTTTNLSASNIVSGVTIKVGDAGNASRIIQVTGTASTGGTDTTDATLTSGDQMLSAYTAYAKGTKYTGTIITRSSADVTVTGPTVTTTSGYYSQAVTKSVQDGEIGANNTTIALTPTISINTNGLITVNASGSSSTTVYVNGDGWVSDGDSETYGTGVATANGSATSQLTSQAASTYYTSTADQTIASQRWLVGAQTIKSVVTTNLSASNIVSGVTIKIGDSGNASRIAQVIGTAQIGTDTSDATLNNANQLVSGVTAYAGGSKYTGSLVVNNYYTGTTAPSSSLGNYGDIYLQYDDGTT